MNISSLIVHADPAAGPNLSLELAALPGVEVHAVSAEGKLIVSIESDSEGDTTDMFEFIGRMNGVLSVSLVYQQTESDPDKELSNATDSA